MSAIVEGKECLGCGYEMAGITSDRCPECGRLNEPLKLLATYREKQLGVRRVFFLYDDRIVVRAHRRLGNESEVSIRLNLLNPDLGVLRVRDKSFQAALTTFLTGTAMAAVSFYVAQSDRISLLEQVSFWIFVAVGALGLICLPMTFKRVEFYFFRDIRRPEVKLLDIARRGPDAGHFEEFVGELRRHIRLARHNESAPPKANPPPEVPQ